MRKISGPALCGFADCFEDPLLGAVPHPTKLPTGGGGLSPHRGGGGGKQGGPASTAPSAVDPTAKTKPYPAARNSSTVANHAAVLSGAKKTLASASKKVGAAARSTLKKPTPPIPHGPSRVAVHGLDYVVIGAPPPPAQSAKVKKAQAALAAANAKVQKATAAAATKTKAAGKSLQGLATQIKNQENVARRLSGKGPHGIHGYYIGQDDGSLPPDTGTPPDAGTPPDLGTPPPPSSPTLDVDTLIATANMAPVPLANYIADSSLYPVIMYDGSRGTPDGYLGSLGLFTRATDHSVEPDTAMIEGNEHYGYVFGKYDTQNPNNGGVGWGSSLRSGGWNHIHGRHYFSNDNDGGWWSSVADTEAWTSNTKASPRSIPYGPLVGNPTMKDFNNLRVDGNGKVFWMANEAPDWATAPLKAAAALTKANADKAQKDADAAAAAAAAKAAADAAAAQAAQNAQNALDEANAASQATQQASAAQGASAQSDADYAAAQAGAAQQQVAERQYAFQQQQAQDAYDAQQAPQDGGGGYADQGGGYADDGGGSDDGGGGESDSAQEAADIDSGSDADVVGEAMALEIMRRKQELSDDMVIGGDGEVIGVDEWGNLLE